MYQWRISGRLLEWEHRPLILGILNVTPDSFSDGGEHFSTEKAVAHALAMVSEGADLLDIGGESTRPYATPVTLDEELRRVVPVVEALVAAKVPVPISIDTYKSEVARQCLAAGAQIVNDVKGLQGDAAMVEVVRAAGAGAIVMHMQGEPQTMQDAPQYKDVVADVAGFLEDRLRALAQQGIDPMQVVVDPGIGFGKTKDHTWEMLRRLKEFQRLGRPICLGVSRKSFIGKLLGSDDTTSQESIIGSVAIACAATCQSAVQILRVHDVKATSDALKVVKRLMTPPGLQ